MAVGLGVGLLVGAAVGCGVAVGRAVVATDGDGDATGRRSVPSGAGAVDAVMPRALRRLVAFGATAGAAIAPTVKTVAVVTLSAPELTHEPRRLSSDQSRLRAGICPNHALKPIVRQRRPTETFRNARTTPGSSCEPATRVSSCRAEAMLIARLYGRGAVMTS